MTKVVVRVTKLVKKYDNKPVVNGVSFAIKQGEVFGILGPNGAGKTTTLEMIEGIRPIDTGEAYIDDINISKHSSKIRYLIGVQPQSPAFQDKTKTTEVLEIFAASYGAKIDTAKLLNKVKLSNEANTYTENLSGGQQQRLSIAAAIVHSPKVLFMDEPTTGLDPQARRNIWELIKSIQKQGTTVVLTTHYMEEAEILCDRVAIMDSGKIIALDSPQKLVKQLLGRGFKKKRHIEQANLEDVFIDLTGKDLRD